MGQAAIRKLSRMDCETVSTQVRIRFSDTKPMDHLGHVLQALA